MEQENIISIVLNTFWMVVDSFVKNRREKKKIEEENENLTIETQSKCKNQFYILLKPIQTQI